METERLIIRRFEEKDTESSFKNWASIKEVQENYGEPVFTSLEELKKLILKYNSTEYRFAIINKENDECIGQIAYFLIDENNHFAEIEYCVGTKYQNKGFATEATKAMVKFGFEEMKLHKVQICHRPINVKSKRVIEKCGFIYEGTLRDYFYKDGSYQGRSYYSILESEYQKMAK